MNAATEKVGAPTMEMRLAQRAAKLGAAPVMYQRWSELLFLHWRYEAAEIQRSLPEGLTVDVWEGSAWVGLVPFRMSGIRPRGLPALPWLSAFPELNVRTYVIDGAGRPGVWFYSLDASRWLAVRFARWAFCLPYFHAEMRSRRDADSGWIDYRSRRRDGGAGAEFAYRGRGAEREAEPGTLEFFLLERYLLLALDGAGGDSLRGGHVAHRPYRFREAEVGGYGTELIAAAGLKAPDRAPDHAAYVESVDVSVFPLERAVNLRKSGL